MVSVANNQMWAFLRGVLTPVITPFDSKGKVDLSSMATVLEFLLEKQKVDGIVVGGTTGEVSYISNEEYELVIGFTVKYIDSRVPLIAGVEGVSLKDTMARIGICNSLPLDALLIPPIGKGLSQKEILNQFTEFNKISKKPIIIYNKNELDGTKINTDTILKLSCLKNVIAVKDSGENLEQAKQILNAADRKFYFLSGCDELNLQILQAGGDGTISAASHLIGKDIKELCVMINRHDDSAAEQINSGLLPKIKYLFQIKKPGLIKKIYKDLGLISSDYMRMQLDFSKAGLDRNLEASLISANT